MPRPLHHGGILRTRRARRAGGQSPRPGPARGPQAGGVKRPSEGKALLFSTDSPERQPFEDSARIKRHESIQTREEEHRRRKIEGNGAGNPWNRLPSSRPRVESRRHGATVDQKENHLVPLHTSGGNTEDILMNQT